MRSTVVSLIGFCCVSVGSAATPGAQQSSPRPRASVYVLDFAGDGVALTAADRGVAFDIEGTGTRVRVGWTHAGSDDAFLALDSNGNGEIDSAAELISTRTALSPPRDIPTANEVLRILQGLVRGPDGQLPSPLPPGSARFDRDDKAFGSLLVWVDANHDGRSTRSELRTLDAAEVSAIYGGFRRTQDVDAQGNQTLLRGNFWLMRRGVELQRELAIVVLAGTP